MESPISEDAINCLKIEWCESETSEIDPMRLSPMLQIIKEEPPLDLYEHSI